MRGLLNILLVAVVLVLVNVIASRFYGHLDLTEDKRFSLTTPTKTLLNNIEEPILVRIFLNGEFPAGFTRLRQATIDLLDRYQSINSSIRYISQDPSLGSVEEINARKQELKKDGILPTTLSYGEGDAFTNKQIYPYAVFSLGTRRVVINLLEEQIMGVPEEIILNNSVSLLEYKFSDAIKKLTTAKKSNIVFTEGNGELSRQQTASIENSLRQHYNTGRVVLDSIYQINSDIDVLVVAKPRTAFSQRSQFVIDQYIMNGGRVMWLIDYLDVNVDSINQNQIYVPPTMNLDLDDMWFKYGFRLQPNLVLDLQSSSIPQVIGMSGGEPQQQLFKWPYHVLAFPISEHPIVKNLDRINLFFPSSIDTLKTDTPLNKTILLTSSPYTRFQLTPMRLNFQILQEDTKEELFNKKPQNLALLIEGEFESAFKNRVAASMEEMLDQIGSPFKDKSIPTKQIVISDGDIINNVVNVSQQRIYPLGYNKWEKRTYRGNETILLNAIEYLLDDTNILSARSKEVRLRLLDSIKAKSERTKWRIINILIPLLVLLVFGFLFNFYRKRKYSN